MYVYGILKKIVGLWILQTFLLFISFPWTSLCFTPSFTSPVKSTPLFFSFPPSLQLYSTISCPIVLSTHSFNVTFLLTCPLQFLQVTQWQLKIWRQHLHSGESQQCLTFLGLGYFTQHSNFQFHPFTWKIHNLIFLPSCTEFPCIFVPYFNYLFISWWTSGLTTFPSFYE